MAEYTHFQFHPERRRMEADSLTPPLRLLENRSMPGVGYLPKIGAGNVFVSFLEGRLAAFEESGGKPVWDFRLPHGYRAGIPDDGDLLISEHTLLTRLNGELFILDASTGKLHSRQPAPAFDLRSAILQENRLFGVYLDEADENEPVYCFAYDLARQTFSWQYAIERIPYSLAMSTQSVFLSDRKGYFTCLSAETGAQVWTTPIQEIGQYTDVDQTIRSGDVTGVPLLWGDLLIVPVEGYHVVALEQATGAVRWSQLIDIDDPRNLVCSPNGMLATVDSEIYVNLDVATGRMLSHLNIAAALRPYGGPLVTRMDVTDHMLYFSIIHKGILVALDRQSGEIPWTFQCAAAVPFNNAPVVVNGRLYLLDEDHNLYVFAGA
ncbi:MAG TPA: PQQ-binding-like beta-propeller repeat protein [Roseiflexaceae bacterium]|nr:PQQ-binding-like beta-propeller repeat protein [Roseiflexaceae bacterium]